jgi:hypothetical protein
MRNHVSEERKQDAYSKRLRRPLIPIDNNVPRLLNQKNNNRLPMINKPPIFVPVDSRSNRRPPRVWK